MMNASRTGSNRNSPESRFESLCAIVRQLAYCRDAMQKAGLGTAAMLTESALLTVIDTLEREGFWLPHEQDPMKAQCASRRLM